MTVKGLPTCTNLTYAGDAQFIGTVYAPEANFKIVGDSDAYGSFLAKSFVCNGKMGLHYDEALATPTNGVVKIGKWQEMADR